MKRSSSAPRRGFALLFVVMIVAVVAVAAAALLDIVEVDMLIAGEYRRSAAAKAVAEGAIKEIQADSAKADLLPTTASPDLLTTYSGFDFDGNFVKAPGTGLETALTEANSAYVRNNAVETSASRQGYVSEMRLLRFGPVMDSGVNTIRAVIYEVRTQSSVAGGAATAEVFAEAFSYASAQSGTVGQIHGR